MTSIIESNPEILNGKAVFRGTRIPVDLVFELVSVGYTIDQILEEYPDLPREHVVQVLKIGKSAVESLDKDNLDKILLKEQAST
ncbi:MAG: DUF433 domain-containing protein [Candidatus Odinarchaeota archaeon]